MLNSKLIKICITFLIFIGIILSSTFLVALNPLLYVVGLNKHNTLKEAGLAEIIKPIDLYVAFMRFFFSYNVPSLFSVKTEIGRQTLFNSKEIIHLQDVRMLILLGIAVLILIVAVLAMLLGKMNLKLKYDLLSFSSVVSFVSLLFLGSLIYIFFDRSFTLFHEILFWNDFWLLNPATDILVVIFSENFFYDTFIYIWLTALIISLLVGLVALRLRKWIIKL